MKSKHLLFGVFAVMTAMLSGCLSEPDFEPVVEGGGIPINLDGDILQVATKVNANGFETGDAIGLYAVNYEDANQTPGTLLDKGNQADHVKYIFSFEDWKWTPVKPVYYKDVNTNVDLYAFYPHAEPESVTEYNFEVQKDQSTPRTEQKIAGYDASDFLWAKVENVAPTEAKIKIQFQHKMAGAQVVLTKGTGFDVAGDWDLLDRKVLVTNTTRKAKINLTNGEVAPLGGPQATGIVMAVQTDASFRAIVVPQTVQAGTPLFSITIGGVAYKFSKSEDFTFTSGKLSTFTIKINRKYPSGEYELVLTDTSISDWKEDINTYEGEARQYYCVHCEEPGTLGKLIKADKKNPDKIKNLKVSGKINAGDFYFMRDSMAILQSVNLKETRIMPSYYFIGYKNDGTLFTFAVGESSELGNIYEKYPDLSSYSIPEDSYVPQDVIAPNAFCDKTNLVNFVFPEVVTKISHEAFDGCSVLSGALIIPDDVKEIGQYAFDGCSNISSLSLPIGLEKIDSDAFRGCSSLSGALMLPSTLTYIGSWSFYECRGFSGTLVLPEGLIYIGECAFRNCHGFTGNLRIPESVKDIYTCTFCNCSGMNGRLIMHDNLCLNSGQCPDGSYVGGNHFSNCGFQGELVLPANITSIPEDCFMGTKFTSIAAFPDGLLGIESRAFCDCGRLMGILELPESLVSLGAGAFYGCRNLEGIILPSNLYVISSGAFQDCYQINKIVCKSSTPPIVQSGAFDGVAKDNFTVEVPANAVKKYQADVQWGEFRRIAAHYDFSISRDMSRTLNAGKSQTYVLRATANYAWSVESKPEWITVSPSSGTGKAEVTVTFAPMTDAEIGKIEVEGYYDEWGSWHEAYSYPGRAGEIVFKLDDVEGYTTSMIVEQYDYDYSDGDVIPLHKATKGNGVNLMFMGDCYDAKDIATGAYLADIQEAFGHYFDVEPYKTYKDYFNVYAVFGESPDSGMGTVNTIRDAKFGSQYSQNGISPDFATCYEYAAKADPAMIPGQTLVVMIENTTEYGGVCYMWGDGSAVACCPKSRDAYPFDFRGIVQHEAGGHGFGKLADEYIYHNAFIQSCPCTCCEHLDGLLVGKAMGWYRNLEATGDMHQVGWSHLIFHPKYSNVVDVYEGGYFHTRGVYRSEPTSCMNNNIPYFSAISRQAIVERIMEYAGEEFTLENFYALDSDAFGPTTKGIMPDMPVETIYNGKQHAPVYMGDSPVFRK